jgi:hypothetical protein
VRNKASSANIVTVQLNNGAAFVSLKYKEIATFVLAQNTPAYGSWVLTTYSSSAGNPVTVAGTTFTGTVNMGWK